MKIKAAIGAITATPDVLNERYVQFFEDLASEDTGVNFTYLAAFIDRLTNAQLQTLYNQLQKKFQVACKLDYHPGLMFFTWNILKRMPKWLTVNHTAVKTIAIAALSDGLTNFCHGNKDYDYESPFRLFATYFESQIPLVISTIDVLQKPGPYHNSNILKLADLDDLCREYHSDVIAYFLDLLGFMLLHCNRGCRFAMENIFGTVKICLKCDHPITKQKALKLMLEVAKVTGNYFFIIAPSVLEMVNNFDVETEILYKFLLDLNEITNGQCNIAKYFPSLLLQFADGLKNCNVKESDDGLLLIGRAPAAEAVKMIQETINATIPNMDLLGQLVLSLLELNPTSIPIETLFKIQKQLCGKILSTVEPSILDLKLLNAFLAITDEKLPSPCQVARTVYSRYTVNRNKELSELARIGRALCDAQRSSRFIAYDQQVPEFVNNTNAIDDLINGTVNNSIVEDTRKETPEENNDENLGMEDFSIEDVDENGVTITVVVDAQSEENVESNEKEAPVDVSMNESVDQNESVVANAEKEVGEKQPEKQTEESAEIVEMEVDNHSPQKSIADGSATTITTAAFAAKEQEKENVSKTTSENVTKTTPIENVNDSALEDGEIRENETSKIPTTKLFETVIENAKRDHERREALESQKKKDSASEGGAGWSNEVIEAAMRERHEGLEAQKKNETETSKKSPIKTPQKETSGVKEVEIIVLDSDDDDDGIQVINTSKGPQNNKPKPEPVTPNRKRSFPGENENPKRIARDSSNSVRSVNKNLLDMLDDFCAD